MKCQQCGKTLRGGAKFCPFCGTEQQGLASVVGAGAASLSCPRCGADGLPANARFCQDCGRQLPHAFGAAATAAGDAGKPATSSSGRWTPDERERYLAQLAERDAERAALDVPAPTGRGDIADACAAEEHYSRIDAAWDELNRELLEARSAAGLFPSAADTAELRDLQRRVDAAWASRERARHHRDRLMFEMERANSPGMGLPPGESERW